MPEQALTEILTLASRDHSHLCPRLILGARIGLAGLGALGHDRPPTGKRVLTIAETDGCFLDGLSAATGCTPGHRTLRIEDYGKAAAVFVDIASATAVRVAPWLDLRSRASAYAPGESSRYAAQLRAYQVMPAAEMFATTSVRLRVPLESILSRPRVRVSCAGCGEEIINERTVQRAGQPVCLACAHGGYYRVPLQPAGCSRGGTPGFDPDQG
jgi:formylmethanofuran dehydrogenase subunit E